MINGIINELKTEFPNVNIDWNSGRPVYYYRVFQRQTDKKSGTITECFEDRRFLDENVLDSKTKALEHYNIEIEFLSESEDIHPTMFPNVFDRDSVYLSIEFELIEIVNNSLTRRLNQYSLVGLEALSKPEIGFKP